MSLNLAILMILFNFVLSCAPFVSAEPQKTAYIMLWNYSPPPVGHFNFFIAGNIVPCPPIVEPLTHYWQANGTYLPGLAINWTYKDYEVLTIKLRQGVKFHDGTTFTARDVWATWYVLYLLQPGAWGYIRNVTIVDDYTVRFYMSVKNDFVPFYVLWHYDIQPYSVYGNLAERVYAKIQQGYSIKENPEAFAELVDELRNFRPEKPIGTGPYKFESVSETEYICVKFKEYWNGEPAFDEFIFKRVLATDVFWTMLAQGEFSWHWAIPTLEQHQLMVNSPYYKIISAARPVGTTIYFNQKRYPLNLREVRQAIAYAINRTEIARIQHPAGGTPMKYLIGWNERAALYAIHNETFIERWLKDFTYEYNPARAEQILRGLGFTKGPDGIYVTPNGTRLEFVLMGTVGYGVTGDLGPALEAISTQLERVGIKIIPQLVEPGLWYTRMERGDYDMATGPFGGAEFSFREIYVINSPRINIPQVYTVPWSSEPVNATHLVWYLGTYPAVCTPGERLDILATLSYITGRELPTLSLYTPTAYMYLNTEKIAGWPAAGDVLWQGMGSYAWRGLSYLFRWNIIKPKLELTISVTPSGAGTTDPAPGKYMYAKGDTVRVSAIEFSGYVFKNWLLDGKIVTGKTITVTMDAPHTLEAIFEAYVPPPYELYAGIAIAVIVVAAGGYLFLRRRRVKK